MQGSFSTLSGLWHGACTRMLIAHSHELDHWHGLSTIVYDNFLQSDSMQFDLDVGHDLWMTRSRFTKLQRDYLEWPQVAGFIDRSQRIYRVASKRGSITQLITRVHGSKEDGSYQWGNCLLAFTFHGGLRHPPTLGLHSRTSYINYMAGFDLALSWVIAREIADACDFAVEDMRFRWHADGLQAHAMKGVPYYHSSGCVDDFIDNPRITHTDRPTLRLARSALGRLRRKHQAGLPLSAEKHGPTKRMRTRYENALRGVYMKSVPLESLTLDPLRERSYDG